jgi:glyoxylase-like metal-dependent hydrolase (beta-lactamase superfamily II)
MNRFALVAALMLTAAPAGAQQDFSKVEIKVEKLAPGVAVLFGSGGNIGLSYGEDGNALVDDQFAPLTDKIVAAVKTLDPDPVKFVINTHWHFDHTGGNENFGKMGTVIMAHDNVRKRMSTAQAMKRIEMDMPASPKAALPVVTFDAGVTLHLNGDTLHVIHVRNAHTDGDSLVHWQKGDVLHMGDTFFHQTSFPFVDLDSGGSVDGVIAAVRQGLGIARPNTKIIPGHGKVATKAEMEAYLAMLVDIRTRVNDAMQAGRTREQIVASKPAAAYAMPADAFINADNFVGTVYDSLKAGPGHSH